MRQLIEAMLEEKSYIADRLNNINTSLSARLERFGYNSLNEYFKDKKEYLFNQWIPEVYPIDVRTITTDLEDAIINKRYGVYISTTDDLYAFHGSDEIDYDLCEEMGIVVAELYHQGGTIIGGVEDLGIEIVAPRELGLTSELILQKLLEIIKEYEPDAVIDGNDILINGNKVLGSMARNVGGVFVWACQVSFADHSEAVKKICSKESRKIPSYIKNTTKDVIQEEVLKWLLKK